MRIIVTGSRDWPHYRELWGVLDTFAAAALASDLPELTVVHGGARGADAFAESWVRRAQRGGGGLLVQQEPHRVPGTEWKRIGNAAGHLRNAAMVRKGADFCIAFIWPCTSKRCTKPRPHWSHGATGCADMAEAADIPVQRFYSEPCKSCNDKREIAREMTRDGCRFERCPQCNPTEEMTT